MELPVLTEAIQAPAPNKFTYEMRGVCDLLTIRPRIKVPSYQRTFAWEHSHVEALWVDLPCARCQGRVIAPNPSVTISSGASF